MQAIVFRSVTKVFPQGRRPAVQEVTLEVQAGEVVVILGPSGCGKTTLLKMVNLLHEPTAGEIYLDGREVRSFPRTELRRGIGYVIQQSGLFPHLTVEENIAVVPRLLGWPRKRIEERTRLLLEMVNLDPDEYRRRFPNQLSGGQQQRVGLARALAADPPVLLMDEPFGAVDAITRTRLQDELRRIQQQVRKTILFVTHDVEEALKLADRIVIMREGRVVQYGTPAEIILHPRDQMVRDLMGARDLIRQLMTIKVKEVLEQDRGEPAPGPWTVAPDADLKTALALLLRTGGEELAVVDRDGRCWGRLRWDVVRRVGRACGERQEGGHGGCSA